MILDKLDPHKILPWRTSKRTWWAAGLLSYLVPGLGQVYNGQVTKGLLFYCLFSFWGSLFVTITLKTMKKSYSSIYLIMLLLVMAVFIIAFLLVIAEAIKSARKIKSYQIKSYNRWFIYLLPIILTQLSDYSLRSTIKEVLLKPYLLSSISMAPTLLDGDWVLTDPLTFNGRNPEFGDIITLRYPVNEEITFIKRIIAVPGDTLEIKNKSVFINRQKMNEPYAVFLDPQTAPKVISKRDYFGPVIIPADRYFVMGDNRDFSFDSRHWGTVKRNQIFSSPNFILLSFKKKFPFIRKKRFGVRINDNPQNGRLR